MLSGRFERDHLLAMIPPDAMHYAGRLPLASLLFALYIRLAYEIHALSKIHARISFCLNMHEMIALHGRDIIRVYFSICQINSKDEPHSFDRS